MHTPATNVLIVEDESEIRDYLHLSLTCRGLTVTQADNGEEALSYLRSRDGKGVSLILLDVMLPRRGGLETLREIRRLDNTLPVVMLSGISSTTTVVEAMKSGANDFVVKPVNDNHLMEVIQRTLGSRALAPLPMRESIPAPAVQESFTCGVSWMDKLEGLLRKVGASDTPVLLSGETGVGKEVLARSLHARSPRAARRFLKVNCAALPSELVESELFGYERGAFTGALKTKPGKFELADGGTIFLDEIGDMDFRLQAKLLQVLQDQEFERVGGTDTIRVDVRIMAATHTDLKRAIVEGRFREDLYYRLNVIDLTVPPLRDRREEIIPLAHHFLRTFAGASETIPDITPELSDALLAHDWPGNVRELQNFLRKYLVLRDPQGAAEELRRKSPSRLPAPRAMLPEISSPAAAPVTPAPFEKVTEAQRNAETAAILAALNRTRWNRKQAARMLSIDYKALLYKMKKLGLSISSQTAEA